MSRSQQTAVAAQNTGGAIPPFTAGKNRIINGDFGVWQRGTSFNGVNVAIIYTADRWLIQCNFSSGTPTITQQSFTPGTAPVTGYESAYFLQVANSSGSTDTQFQQRVEDVRTFAGQTVTLSFWAKATSSVTMSNLIIQNFGSGGSANVTNSSTQGAQTIGTSWARYSVTFNLASVSGKTIGTGSFLQVYPMYYNSGTIASNTISIWGVQLESGSVATPFTTATGTVQGELAACQRYYQKSYSIAETTGGNGKINFNTPNRTDQYAIEFNATFRISMRTAPTMTLYSPATNASGYVRDEISSADRAAITKNIGENSAQVEGNTGVTTTANALHSFQWIASAEL